MKPLPKARAGGIVRVSLDNTWQTPPRVARPARAYFQGGVIPFDAATALANPMGAERFCVGDWTGDELARKVAAARVAHARRERDAKRKKEARAEVRRLEKEREDQARQALVMVVGAARGLELGAGLGEKLPTEPVAWLDEGWFPFAEWAYGMKALREGAMPFCSGLEVPWKWPTWVNPPYGRELRGWLAKIEAEARKGAEILALLPCARWEQRYFHRILRAAGGTHTCLVTSRVAFVSSLDGEEVGGNPYASMLLGWNTDGARFWSSFHELGACFEWAPLRRRAASPRSLAAPAESAGPLFQGVT